MAEPTDRTPTSGPVTLLRLERKRRGLSVRVVAEAVGCDRTNLSRLELGQQTPTRSVARALHAFYSGAVPLGDVYDPTFRFENGR
jgi:transcriptional regulator with XRE-family HTH domain